MPLAKSLHRDIVALGKRIENAALAEETSRRRGTTEKTDSAHHAELLAIIRTISALLARIESDIPTLQLAITASGETLSSSLPAGISPSRFLQASFFLNMGDTQFASDPNRPVQIGPSFHLSLYMLFTGHSKQIKQQNSSGSNNSATPGPSRSSTPMRDEPYGLGDGERKPIWQEVLHKARVRLCRTPMGWCFDHAMGYVPSVTDNLASHGSQGSPFFENAKFGRPDEFSYHLEIVEDLDDGRFHDEEAKACTFDGMPQAGIRESVPIHQIAKIFYTDSGRILNIGNTDEAGNNPILLLKRDTGAPTAQEVVEAIMQPRRASPDCEDGSSTASDEQVAIDRQIREESELPDSMTEHAKAQHPFALHLPPHLDPEWFALEVFAEDEDDESSESQSEIEDSGELECAASTIKSTRPSPSPRHSLDANILSQMKTLSTTDLIGRSTSTTPSGQVEKPKSQTQRDAKFMARSPFGSVTSSLSLMEMLIRLTSLQEFQQAAHLSIPDYILSFFLEETSTTGLKGEERWKARNEAKQRVGFDPYTDTPTK